MPQTDNARGPERIVWDAMVWAAQQPAPPYGAAYPSYTDRGNSDAEIKCRETVTRIRADLAPDPLGAVKVKPLAWQRGMVDWARPLPGMKYVACSTTPAGSWAWFLEGAPETRAVEPSEEAAKAAAQADYAARIMAALEPTPLADPRVVALVETAKWARNRLETIADENWRGDARDFKRSLVGVFADFDAALAALSPTGGNADG